jgi:dGTPase
MISDVIANSTDKNIICMSAEVYQATMELRKFMFDNVYIGSIAKKEEEKVYNIIGELYNYFINHPEDLPSEMRSALENADIHRIVCDYIAGMTDRYALHKFYEIFIPVSWRKV